MRGNPRVRETQEQDGTALEPMPLQEGPTATDSGIALRSADFATLAEALDYAATGDSGFNYYDGRGDLTAACPTAICGTAPGAGQAAGAARPRPAPGPGGRTPIRISR